MAEPDYGQDGVWAIVVGGGSGRRFGRAKQFEPIQTGDEERVIDRSVRTAAVVCDGVIVVVPSAAVDAERSHFMAWGNPAEVPVATPTAADPNARSRLANTPILVTSGGETRSQSVRSGLALVPDAVRCVCVHDAARPCATEELYRRVIAAVLDGADGAVPGLGVVDTIKRVDPDGWVIDTPDRETLFAVQTPQAFDATVLRRAHIDAAEGSDDAGLVESAGGRVRVVEGERTNIKVTHPDDLQHLSELIAATEVRR